MAKIDKIPLFEWFYNQGDIHLTVIIKDMKRVVLPQHFYEKEIETFVVGMTPTPKLTYDEEGVTAPMRFNEVFFNCFFPWESIVRMIGEEAVIQFRFGEEKKNEDKKEITKKEKPEKKSQHLKLVK